LKRANFEVRLANTAPKQSTKLYLPFYRYLPSFFQVIYRIGEKDAVQKGLKTLIKKWLEEEVKQEFKKYRPDVILSTNFFYNPVVAKILDYQKETIPFLVVVSDPWTIHPLLFSPQASLNLVYDQKGIKLGRKNKIPRRKLASIGWLVRKKFYQKHQPAKIRQRLGLKKGVFTLLVCGGSEGTNMILKIIPGLLTLKKPLQLIIVCGHNKLLYKTVSSFKKLLQKVNQKDKTKLNLRVFRFTEKMPQLMAISDLVMGKAGPNLLFETTAQTKPFFAICHIANHEEGNLQLIKEKGLGLVEENPLKAARLLKKIINQPKILTGFQPGIAKEKAFNRQAGANLVQAVNQLVG